MRHNYDAYGLPSFHEQARIRRLGHDLNHTDRGVTSKECPFCAGNTVGAAGVMFWDAAPSRIAPA